MASALPFEPFVERVLGGHIAPSDAFQECRQFLVYILNHDASRQPLLDAYPVEREDRSRAHFFMRGGLEWLHGAQNRYQPPRVKYLH